MAIEEYKKAIELDPKNALYHNDLGFIYKNQGKNDLAIAECKKAIKLNPSKPLYRENLEALLKTR